MLVASRFFFGGGGGGHQWSVIVLAMLTCHRDAAASTAAELEARSTDELLEVDQPNHRETAADVP
jgi:hypothetical protein